jgi:hypothetical protein
MLKTSVQDQATSLHLSVLRTLRGAKPRHVRQRLQHLLRLIKQTVTVLVPSARRDAYHKASRLMLAGAAWERALRLELLDTTRREAALKDRKDVTRRFKDGHLVARVLSWVVLVITLGAVWGCGGQVDDPTNVMGRCGAEPLVCPGGQTMEVERRQLLTALWTRVEMLTWTGGVR